MFHKNRLFPLILSAALLIPFLSGCGSDSGSDSTTGSQNPAGSGGQTSEQAAATSNSTPSTSTPTSAPTSNPDSTPSIPSTPGQSGIVLEYGDSYALSGQASVADPTIAEIAGGVLRAKAVGQTQITVGGEQIPLTVNPAVVDVVLFTGQSNMVGRETSRYTVDIPEGQAYEFKYLTASLDTVKNPVGETFGEVEVSSGSSIVPKFCADYVAGSGRKIVAVHVARGGRSISYFDSRNGLIYQDILKKYGACIEYLEANPNFTVGHRFYVMYQGESDTNHGMSGDSYKTRYNRFHNGMITGLGMEFGAMIANGRNSDPIMHEGIIEIQQTKSALAAEKDDLIMADVSPYNWYIQGVRSYIRSDLIHLNAEGLKIVGSESCKNILNYMGFGDPALAGVDPVTYLVLAEDASQNPPEGDTEPRNWDFGDGKVAGATLVGTVTPTIANGRYVNDRNSYARYQLENRLVLSASRDFEIEWKGFTAKNMSNNASILLSGGETVFLTFQGERGVYLRCGENRFDISDKISIQEIYTEHVWRLSYSASKHQVSVYMDGKLIKSGSWSSDLIFTDLFGCTNNLYTYVGELDYLKISFELTPVEDEPEPPKEDLNRNWDFNDGKIDGAERVGTVTPTIENGKYVNNQNDRVRYHLEKSITLSAGRDFEIEWSGKAYTNMSNSASILLSNGAEMFLTFQKERGVYLRCGDHRFDIQSSVNVGEIYKDHVWKLVYSAEKHMLSVYLDGTLVKTGSWSWDLTFTDLLGCTNNQYTFVGELDYLKITVK